MLHAVIMAGGSGTRFWPQSRQALPKQFLRLAGPRTMIQATVDRCAGWIPYDRIWVVTNTSQADETIAQLPELPPGHVLREPCARNTAPCVGLAAVQIRAIDPDATMLVLPADHVIQPPERFRDAVQAATRLVDHDPRQLVLFGVPPTFPATGYGYIQRGSPLPDGNGAQVASFSEKPDLDKARKFLEQGDYFWNCGIFVWRVATILDALARHESDMHAGLERLQTHVGSPQWNDAVAVEFPRFRSISIDYAVLERESTIAMVEAPFEWDDVGSWQAVRRLLGADSEGNTIDGPHAGLRTGNCIVRTTPDHLVATIGVSDLIIVHTPDATLVARKSDEEAVKKLVEQLRATGWERFL